MFLIRLVELMELSKSGHSYNTMRFYYDCGRIKNYHAFYRYFFNAEIND